MKYLLYFTVVAVISIWVAIGIMVYLLESGKCGVPHKGAGLQALTCK